MDINMPVMDGIEATEYIRTLERERNAARTAIIALTAVDTQKNELRQQYQRLGFDALVGKPLSKRSFQDLLGLYGVRP